MMTIPMVLSPLDTTIRPFGRFGRSGASVRATVMDTGALHTGERFDGHLLLPVILSDALLKLDADAP